MAVIDPDSPGIVLRDVSPKTLVNIRGALQKFIEPTKPFNEFASEMAELKEKRIALGEKISAVASKRRIEIPKIIRTSGSDAGIKRKGLVIF